MVVTIDKGEASDAHPTPLLFVHGAWHGAWCWDEHFLDHFAGSGYRAVAVNLPAHGGRASGKSLHRHSIADYLAAVNAAVDDLPSPPVLVGHSLGGYLVQRLLETRRLPAGVLIASVPTGGPIPSMTRWARQRPARFALSTVTGNTLHLLNTPQLVRERMLSPDTAERDVLRCHSRLQNESALSSWGAMLRRPRPELVDTPLLVIGAEGDAFFTPDEVRATARAYGTDAVLFPNTGHDMMIESTWRDVAEHIDGWLVARGL